MSKRKGLSDKEIEEMECNAFVIQISADFYSKNGKYSFSPMQADKYYSIILDNILRTLENGESKQKKAAMRCLSRLHVYPLRIQ